MLNYVYFVLFDNIIIIFFILLASPIKKIKIIIKFLNEKI